MTRGVAALLLGCVLTATGVIPAHAQYGATTRVTADAELGSTRLEAREAAMRPGALGEPARALLDAPGTARSGFAGSALAVWGATPAETRTYVDGVEIPALFHPSGFRTTVHPALLGRVTLLPGAPAAAYGRALGGAVLLDSRRLRTGIHGALRADAIDSSLAMEGGNDTVRALAAVRYGYLDRVVRGLAPSSADLLAAPAHADGVARVELTPDADTRVTLTWIGARDRVRLRGDALRAARGNDFHTVALRLERRYGDGARMFVTPFVGVRAQDDRSVTRGVPLAQHARGTRFGVRAEYTRSLGAITARLGLDAQADRDRIRRRGTPRLPARDGDVRVFGQAPTDELEDDAFRATTVNVAPWAAVTVRVGPVSITPALRLESYLLSRSRKLPEAPLTPPLGLDRGGFFPEPRLSVVHHVDPWLRLEARGGLYHQPPAAADASAAFGAPGLPPARAAQGALAARVTLPWALTLELSGFAKQLRALAVRADAVPQLPAEALTARGRGDALGGSLVLARERDDGAFGTASYTLSRSRRTDARGALVPFDYDQPHVLAVMLGYAHAGFTASARLRTASGVPRTEVTGHYLDVTSGRAQPLFGPHDAARAPRFAQLDLHADHAFAARPRVSIAIDVFNLTNHRNVEQVGYDADYVARRDVVGLPLSAMVGLSVEL